MDTGRVENTCYVTFDRNVFIMAKQKRYSKEFKRQAAELVIKQGYTRNDPVFSVVMQIVVESPCVAALRSTGVG